MICGSLRKGSYNAMLARALPALAPEGMTFTDGAARRHDAALQSRRPERDRLSAERDAFADAIRAADGVIIVSPEYNWTIPGTLKNAIDWVSRMKDQPFKDKPVALQSASRRAARRLAHAVSPAPVLTSIDALIFGRPEVIVTFAPQKFDEATRELKDQATRDMIKLQLAAFAKFIERVSGK